MKHSKTLKMILSALTLPLTFACGLPCTVNHCEQKPLRFRENGKFRILQLSDIHELDPDLVLETHPDWQEKTEKTMRVIELAVEKTKPDLVVFTGDNISGMWEEFTFDSVAKTIRRIIEPVAKRNIPLAVVFGNHDAEIGVNREFQVCIYNEYSNCRMSFNDEEMSGCGTYNLTIKSSDGKKDVFNLWLVDSGDYDPNGGYNFVQTDQIEWYEKKSTELREKNGGHPVPSILFQHMIVPEIYDCLVPVAQGTPGATRGEAGHRDKWYCLEKYVQLENYGEAPCPPTKNNGEFESWLRQGDVLAGVFGHDHLNSFVVDNMGIKLIQTIAAGYHTYGGARGGRIFDLDENDVKNFSTKAITIDEAESDNPG